MINHEMIFPKMNKKTDTNPFSKSRVIFVNGTKGSGKSTLVMNLLMLIEKEQDIEEEDALYFSGNCKDPLLKALSFPVTDKASELEDFILRVRNNNDDKKRFVLVLDDCQSNPNVKVMNARSSDFTNFVLSSRHYKVTIIVTAQTFANSFSPVFKGNVDMFFIFQPKTKKENDNIINFFDETEKIDRALKLLKLKNEQAERDKEHKTFLYINLIGAQPQYFLGFKDKLNNL